MNLSILALLAGMISIQIGASVAKGLFPLVGIEATVLFRVWISAAILFAFWRPWQKTLSRNALRALIPYGVSLGLMNLLFYMSIARIPLGIAVALEFTGPLTVALYSSRKPLDFLWALLAVVGIILIVPRLNGASNLDLLGAALALAAGVCWGAYIVFGKRASAKCPAGAATAIGMLFAGLAVLPFGIVHTDLRDFTGEATALALAVALLSGAIPYSLEMFALKRLPSKTFSILMSLEPAFAALAGLALVGERLNSTQIGAIVCVMAASMGSAWTAKKTKKAEQTLALN